jgi:hypothetical protein
MYPFIKGGLIEFCNLGKIKGNANMSHFVSNRTTNINVILQFI